MSHKNSALPTTTIGNIKIAAISMAMLVEQMSQDCFSARNKTSHIAKTVFDANGQGLSLYASDKDFANDLDQGDIIHADGGFIVTLSKFKKGPKIPERSATTDLIWVAARRAQKENLSFFLLGGEPGLAERASNELVKKFPRLKIAGFHHGYFGAGDEIDIVKKINASNADIVWVGLGKPLEQKFCNKHKSILKAGWLVTCGGCFNFITGDYVRAPLWMQKNGLEWLHRLASRPRALFVRYLITTPHSLFLALTR
ncbi:MAG: WecB/TagA/CpsF family glycosyltransferase [Devosiaceae bacterium]|nr:WecB/TagA/CpsF family glycosyltransferase [Devosiaceae bacterium]